jgi:cyclohexyl-isocyanide hydratase
VLDGSTGRSQPSAPNEVSVAENSAAVQIGLLVFPNVQQLDLTGPYEVFASWPQARVRLVAKTLEPVAASTGLWLKPDMTFDDAPQLDVLCVPGGPGINALMSDEAAIAFVRRQAERARFVTSVCTGALLLGAAGLLREKRATTHWASHHLLETLGATPVHARVVRDGNLVTGGGVTAGIDFALTLIAELAGRGVAEAIALNLEYAPAPPFDAGSPERAPAEVVQALRKRMAPVIEDRQRLAEQAARRLRFNV